MSESKEVYIFSPDIYGEVLAVHISASAAACLVTVILAYRIIHKFTLRALLGLLVAYAYVNQTLLGFASKWVSVGAASAVIETVAQALICVIQLRLGCAYRPAKHKKNRLYTLAIGSTVVYTLCLSLWAVLYASLGTNEPDLNGVMSVIYLCHIIVQLVALSFAYAYAFTPSLRVAFNRKSAREPKNSISAHDAAEGFCYSIVMAVHILQTTIFTLIPTLAMYDATLIALNALRVALTCLVVFILALPLPPSMLSWMEHTFADRVASGAELTADTTREMNEE